MCSHGTPATDTLFAHAIKLVLAVQAVVMSQLIAVSSVLLSSQNITATVVVAAFTVLMFFPAKVAVDLR